MIQCIGHADIGPDVDGRVEEALDQPPLPPHRQPLVDQDVDGSPQRHPADAITLLMALQVLAYREDASAARSGYTCAGGASMSDDVASRVPRRVPAAGTALAPRGGMLHRKPIEILSSLVVAAALGVSAPGCVVRGTGAVWVVDVEPPPPRATATIVARPGFVWIEGNWSWIGGRWTWRDGYWERERAGHVWVQGAWIHTGGRWHWRAGRWRPQVRDHRHH